MVVAESVLVKSSAFILGEVSIESSSGMNGEKEVDEVGVHVLGEGIKCTTTTGIRQDFISHVLVELPSRTLPLVNNFITGRNNQIVVVCGLPYVA